MPVCGADGQVKGSQLSFPLTTKNWWHFGNGLAWAAVPGVLWGTEGPPSDCSVASQGLVSSRHRLIMCQLAVQNSDWIRVDPWECYQDTWQTTCSVLEHHRDLMKVSRAPAKGRVDYGETGEGLCPQKPGIRNRDCCLLAEEGFLLLCRL
ncbi:Hypothetical predicted protein [Marmota monax]|uniref:Uncharacterized protein n=1 Tax=Marmota monax TaxID=9995 RepID=A0A5E4BH47_MARMO|nr:hypothetical protein GHT09_019936 [Marmota monax]VTJ68291.1 Hypothetical predicted protein [Marmota monax]